MLPLGQAAVQGGREALTRLEIVRINDRILDAAGSLSPGEVRSLDAIHLATAQELGADRGRVVTYDERMAAAAAVLGLAVVAPS